MDCIFCKIIAKEVPGTIRWEDERWIAFDDIHPKAVTHVLVVPKRHIPSLLETTDADKELLGEVADVLRQVAHSLRLANCKIVSNNGKEAGQIVDHWHFHVLSGAIVGGV